MEFAVNMPNLMEDPPDLNQFPLSLRSALHFLAVIDVHAIRDSALELGPALLAAPKKLGYNRLTVVLDLDETLAHCRLERLATPRYSFTVQFEESNATGYVYVRPFAHMFLQAAARLFEIVVFTASSQTYADQVLDQLDPDGSLITRRLYRQHCTEVGGGFLKDMRRLGRPLDAVVLVDNSPVSLVLCPDNGIICSCWTAEHTGDRELMDLLLLLQQCTQHGSTCDFLARRYGLSAFLEELRDRPDILDALRMDLDC